MARNKYLSVETRQSILVLRNEGYSMREIAKKLKISYNAVFYSLHRAAQTVSNQNRKRSGRPVIHSVCKNSAYHDILITTKIVPHTSNDLKGPLVEK